MLPSLTWLLIVKSSVAFSIPTYAFYPLHIGASLKEVSVVLDNSETVRSRRNPEKSSRCFSLFIKFAVIFKAIQILVTTPRILPFSRFLIVEMCCISFDITYHGHSAYGIFYILLMLTA